MRTLLPALGLALSAPAWACSFLGNEELPIDASLADGVGPEAPEVSVAIDRGRGPQKNGPFGGYSSTSCDDLGRITLGMAGSSAEGYLIDLVDGELPEGLTLPETPVLGSDILLVWIDGATDEQEPVEFTIEVVPVDAGGDLGEAVEVVVSDPGSEPGGSPAGCATGAAPAGPGALLLGAGLLWRRRRAGRRA